MARQVFRRHFLQAAGGVIIPVIEKIARVLGKAFMGNGLLYSQRKPAAAAPDAFQAVFQLTPGNKGRVIPHQSQIPGGSAGQAAGVAVDGPAGIKGMGKGIDVAAGGRPQFFQAGDGAFDDAGFRFEAEGLFRVLVGKKDCSRQEGSGFPNGTLGKSFKCVIAPAAFWSSALTWREATFLSSSRKGASAGRFRAARLRAERP